MLPHASELNTVRIYSSIYKRIEETIIDRYKQGYKFATLSLNTLEPKLHDWELQQLRSLGYSISFTENPAHNNFYGYYEIRWDNSPTAQTVKNYYDK